MLYKIGGYYGQGLLVYNDFTTNGTEVPNNNHKFKKITNNYTTFVAKNCHVFKKYIIGTFIFILSFRIFSQNNAENDINLDAGLQ